MTTYGRPKSQKLVEKLVPWYREVRRPLPWRVNREAYRIWISEVMLQQTTVTAVIPYFERFLIRFPNLKSLAEAPQEDVLEHWAGLGYYSRARALHKSARELHRLGKFPETHTELLKLPGFGPYTSRAVASLAFGENVGVVDGNVIRVLSRVLDLDLEWWKPKVRDLIQIEADSLAQATFEKKTVDASDLNQALMELGATICTPQSPSCMICPWSRDCLARKSDTISSRPRPKPRREMEIWSWEPEIIRRRDGSLLLVKNDYAPFLKGHMIWPGKAVRLKKKPKDFNFKGGVTHHDIYVTVKVADKNLKSSKLPHPNMPSAMWVSRNELKSKIPSSLIRKALDILDLE